LGNIKYSMRMKTLNPGFSIKIDELTSITINPGPGTYEFKETITKTGKLYISKHKSSGCTTINPPTSKRFPPNPRKFILQVNKIPGPGEYEKAAVAMSKNGSYYVSKYHNSMCSFFNNDKRHGVMESLKE